MQEKRAKKNSDTYTSHSVLMVLDHAQEELVEFALLVCHLDGMPGGRSCDEVESLILVIILDILEIARMFNNNPANCF